MTLTIDTAKTIDLCAGPGGWEEAARILGGQQLLDQLAILGVELNADACATAIAAGHHRIHGNVLDYDPADAVAATGLITSFPCPTFSSSGKRSGLGDDYDRALDAITCLGSGCGEHHDISGEVADPRTALVVQAARWALTMPNLEWMVCEQVPALEYLWEDLAAELYAAGWEWVDVVTFDAVIHGTPSRRRRSYLIGRRYVPGTTQSATIGLDDVPTRTLAGALGWGPGELVNTRGNRRTSGGNNFSADRPAWCLTGKARGWYRLSDGATFTASEGGRLNGFPDDYPWTGSRSSQFQQIGDVVAPPAGAAVLSGALGIDWRGPVRSWLAATMLPAQLTLTA